jgi:hypothetical protein
LRLSIYLVSSRPDALAAPTARDKRAVLALLAHNWPLPCRGPRRANLTLCHLEQLSRGFGSKILVPFLSHVPQDAGRAPRAPRFPVLRASCSFFLDPATSRHPPFLCRFCSKKIHFFLPASRAVSTATRLWFACFPGCRCVPPLGNRHPTPFCSRSPKSNKTKSRGFRFKPDQPLTPGQVHIFLVHFNIPKWRRTKGGMKEKKKTKQRRRKQSKSDIHT